MQTGRSKQWNFGWSHANRLIKTMNLTQGVRVYKVYGLIKTMKLWLVSCKRADQKNESDTTVLESIKFFLVVLMPTDRSKLWIWHNGVRVYKVFLVGLMQTGWSKQWFLTQKCWCFFYFFGCKTRVQQTKACKSNIFYWKTETKWCTLYITTFQD